MGRTGLGVAFASKVCLLGLLLCGCGAFAASREVSGNGTPVEPLVRVHPHVFRLRMHHLHTEEWIDVAYRRGDEEVPEGMDKLDHFLRDHRTDEDADYPIEEFDLLYALMETLHKPNGLIEIVCGYRSEASNEYLRSLSAETGVAEHSQHVLSKAIDIRVPGVSTARLRDAALSLGMGGVGYYPRSGFVHVDVGPVREWSYGVPLRRVRGTRGGRVRGARLERQGKAGYGGKKQGKAGRGRQRRRLR